MPIRFVDKVSRLGRIQASLGDVTAVMTGSHDAPEGRTGVVNAMLAPTTALITGAFTPSAHRTGSIAATLAPTTATMTGSFVNAGWGTIPTVEFSGGGGEFSFAPYAPPGATNFQLHASSAALPASVTLDSANKRLVYSGAGSVGVTSGIILEDVTTAAADWQARTSAAGVLWAHRFQSVDDIRGYQRSAPDSGSVNGAGRTTVYDPTIQQFSANEGIIPGDGALRQVYHGGEDWGGSAWQWRRPLQPFDYDINNPGVATLPSSLEPWRYFQNHPEVATVMHTDYQAAHGSPSRTGPFLSDRIYIQLWMKLSPGRITSGDAPDGKCVMLENCYTSNEAQFVMNVGPGSSSAVRVYTNKGSGFNAALENPQTSGPSSGGQRQPGSQHTIPSGAYSGQSAANVCVYNNRNVAGWDGMCWTFPDDKWVSLLYYWKPGHHAASTASVGDPANNAARDTTLTIWAATEDEIRAGSGYTRVHHKTDYVWRYSEDDRFGSSSSYLPFGLQQFLLNHFTGGLAWNITPLTFWHQFDQIICSIEPIPCPTWAPPA